MHKHLLTFVYCLCAIVCFGQKKYGIEQSYYVYHKGANSLVPSVYYQAANGWYGQLRYNYEEEQTLSALAGKTFAKEAPFSWSVTPQAGLLAGRFTGGSVGLQTQLQAGAVWLYTEPQYCAAFSNAKQNFFYNWTELCVQPRPFIYGGLAVQQTKLWGEKLFTEPGAVIGFELGNLELPFYFFKREGEGYFVVGVHWKLRKN